MRTKILLIFAILDLIIFIPPLCMAMADSSSDDLSAQYNEESSGDEAELRRLMQVLDKHTEIATKTKMNADFVPGMVTVLEGDEMEARGIKTVWEALALVPGLELFIQSQGIRRVMVRGTGMTFASGSIKFLLNGISVNAAFVAMESPILGLPIEIVERIEVIRGPGSAVHGEFAYNGVVNVITRKKGNKLFGYTGSNDTYGGGGLFSLSRPKDKFNLSLTLAGMETDGSGSKTGTDALFGTPNESISNAPGHAHENREANSALLTLEYKDFSLTAQFLETNHGEHFGVSNQLPPPSDNNVVKVQNGMLQAKQGLELAPSLWAEFRLGWVEHKYDVNKYHLRVPGFVVTLPVPPWTVTYTNGMIASPYYEESKIEGGIELKWNGWNRHDVLAGWSFADTEIKDVWQETNYDPITFAPSVSFQRFDGAQNWLEEDEDRLLHSVTLQDEFHINKQITLTSGLRYDHYDDVGDSWNPRLAVVWRLTNEFILKAQYAKAFRPPTFLEMYTKNNPVFDGNPDIDPETIDTYDIGCIYKYDHTILRGTFFYSALDDLIVLDQNDRYANIGEARLTGFELEFEHSITHFLKLDANISYVHTRDTDTGSELEGSGDWLGNLGLNYQPHNNLAFCLQYRYVGDKNRAPTDTRDELDDSHTVDLTGNIFNLLYQGVTLRAGVKNLFNEDIRYFAPKTTSGTYQNDYPGPDREWWIQLSYNF